MRPGPNTRRPMRRGNSGGGGRRGGSPRSQNFDSNGPDIKVRGNAQQVVDKYQTLAREAATAGNPVMAENYYQHAEHYYRLLHANGGGENRQNGRQPDNERNQNGGQGRDENDSQSSVGGNPDSAVAEAPASSAQPDVQPDTPRDKQPDVKPADNRRNSQNGGRKPQAAPQDKARQDNAPGDDDAKPAASPTASTEETGEPVS